MVFTVRDTLIYFCCEKDAALRHFSAAIGTRAQRLGENWQS